LTYKCRDHLRMDCAPNGVFHIPKQ
jgi:hypothetical protein